MRTMTIALILAMALPGAARASETAFDILAELPPARVMCVGEAAMPEMLRFAFQAEPEGRGRPEVIRTLSSRGKRPRAVAAATPRQARQAQAGAPMLWLPCIHG